MMTFQEILKLVNSHLDGLADGRQPRHLYEPTEYMLSLGGKRIRPMLVLLAYNLYRKHPEDILMPACGIETYHNYTLLHDDLMDQANLRRGRETVHKRRDTNTTILSGGLMLVLAHQRMARCRPDKLKEIIGPLAQTALEIDEGQQYNMNFEHRNDVTEDGYIEVIRLKTSVLLACALKIGATLSDASAEDTSNLYRFGEKIDLAFQLQDDFLDVYDDSKVFGKAVGDDIVGNKKTYMFVNAFNQVDTQQRTELERWTQLKGFDRQERIDTVTAPYDDMGIGRLVQDKVAAYYEEGKKYLATVQVPTEKKRELTAYVQQMMKRTH